MFALVRQTCPQVKLNYKVLPQVDKVKYLGMNLDCRLT